MLGKILKNKAEFVLFVLGTEVVGIIGAIVTSHSLITWYPTLTVPSFNPPNWVFAPVWTILYFLMASSAFLVYKNKQNSSLKNSSLKLFYIQLAINLLWSVIFFGFKLPATAFITIIFLIYIVGLTLLNFAKVEKTASTLLYPYLCWLIFAACLNLSIVLLN